MKQELGKDRETTMREFIKNAAPRLESDDRDVRDKVEAIIASVRARGDEALLEYTRTFDKLELDSLRVTAKLVSVIRG